MDFWEQIKIFLSHSFLDISLGRLLISLLIFLFIFIFRRLFLRIVFTYIRKITSKTKSDVDDRIVDIFEVPARFFMGVVALWAAIEYMRLPEDAAGFINHVIRSLFAISFFWAAYRATDMFSGFLNKFAAKTETNIDDQLIPFVGKFLRVAVIVFGSMVIVREWGYDIAGLVAGLGLGGLAIALAAKDTVANLFGSLTILLDRPFAVGDWIETPSVEGTVEDVHLRSTRIRTFANALVSVPNSVIANDPITNWSRMKKRRIKYRLGVTYGTTHVQMEKCVRELKEMLDNHPDIHQDTVFVYFNDFADSALEIFMYFFTKTTVWQEYLRVRQDVNLKIMRIVEENGMSIAFPSRSVYMENMGEDEENSAGIDLGSGKMG